MSICILEMNKVLVREDEKCIHSCIRSSDKPKFCFLHYNMLLLIKKKRKGRKEGGKEEWMDLDPLFDSWV